MVLRAAALLGLVLLTGCPASPGGAESAPSAAPAERVVELAISGMHCESCAEAITDALRHVDGVTSAEVSFDRGRAVVGTRSPGPAVEALVAAVEAAGYTARPAPSPQ